MSDTYAPGFGGQPEPTLPGQYGDNSAGGVSSHGQFSTDGPQGASHGAAPGGYGVPPVYWAHQGWNQPYPVRSATDPGVDRPWYGIGYLDAYRRFWRKYATFSGRASRGEFWWAALINVVVSVLLAVVVAVIGSATITPCADHEVGTSACPDGGNGLWFVALAYLYPVAILIPTLAIVWRRLHDTGQSGAMYFISLIPYVGGIVLLIFLAQRSRPEGAKYDVGPSGGYGLQPYAPYGHGQDALAQGYAPPLLPDGAPPQYGSPPPYGR